MFACFLTGRWLAFAALLAALCGCGDSNGPSRVAASGEVEVGGQPAPDGTISFAPLGPAGGPAAVTSIKAGHYRFNSKQGPPPGRHRVLVIAAAGVKQHRFGGDQDVSSAAATSSALAAGRWQTEVDVPDQAACDLPIHLE